MKKSEWIKKAAEEMTKATGLSETEATKAARAAAQVEVPFGPWEPERAIVPVVSVGRHGTDNTIQGREEYLRHEQAERGAEILNGYEAARDLFAIATKKADERHPDLNGEHLVRELRAFFQIEEGGE